MLYSFDSDTLKNAASQEASQDSDEQLMVRLQAGDQNALGILHRRHARLLHSVILRVVNDEDEADDTLQDVFVEIWRNAANFSATKGKALGWLITMCRRRAIDRLRRIQAYNRAGERLRVETEAQPLQVNDADAEIASSDLRQTLDLVLETLPPAQRQAVEMTYYKGLSQREIAVQTGIPLGTIKTRIELGMRKIAGALRANFGLNTLHPV